MDPIQSAIAKKEILDSLRPINEEQEHRIMQKFRLDWNYHSNHIEGNSLSYGETKALLLFNITAQGKPLKDHFEIKGHNEAIDWVLDVIKNKHDLTEHFIRQLHELLLKEPYISKAMTPDGMPTQKRIEVGKYKSQPNHVRTVTGEIFQFATPEETPAKMHDLMDWYHDKRKTPETNGILLAAELHYRFIRVHPFDDGNGRVARILMNFILMQYEYPPVIIKADDKKNYFLALQQADAGMITPFIEYIAANLNNSLDIMISGARGESIEEPDDMDKEMLLLEQEINNTTRKIDLYKSRQTVRNIIDISVQKIIYNFHKNFTKIFPYYKTTLLSLGINNDTWTRSPDEFLDFIPLINELLFHEKYLDIHKLTLTSDFMLFLALPHRSPQIDKYKNEVFLEFHATSYQFGNSMGDKLFKLYNEELTDEQIDKIIKSEVLKHLKFIAEKTKEAESK